MNDEFPGRRVLLVGVCIAACGLISNVLIGLFYRILIRFSLFDFWSIASLCILILGLFVAFLGGVIWACTADKLMSLVSWGIAVAICAFVIVEVLGVGLLRPTAILLPVFYAAELTAAFVLMIAIVRFLWGRLMTHD
jgi:hypothetical protein